MRALSIAMLLWVGCAGSPSDAGAPIALVDDGGVQAAVFATPELDTGGVHLQRACRERAPLACAGGCAIGRGCCVTGARPMGVCLQASECPWRCALDCADIGRRYGAGAVAQCEALCLFVDEAPRCDR